MYDDAIVERPAQRTPRRLVGMALGVAAVLLIGSHFAARARNEAVAVTVERMRLIQDALNRYAIDHCGALPSSAQGLRALVTPSKPSRATGSWRGPYLQSGQVIVDGWRRRFHYVAPGGGDPQRPYDLWSLGHDDAEGGTGADADIRCWDPETLTR